VESELFSTPKWRAKKIALKLNVPLKVDARSGDNWEAAH
jgi:DNA polymerase I-like protein with 3'-5' exonuclease and polymerase domains